METTIDGDVVLEACPVLAAPTHVAQSGKRLPSGQSGIASVDDSGSPRMHDVEPAGDGIEAPEPIVGPLILLARRSYPDEALLQRIETPNRWSIRGAACEEKQASRLGIDRGRDGIRERRRCVKDRRV